jgi:hypothetical protein
MAAYPGPVRKPGETVGDRHAGRAEALLDVETATFELKSPPPSQSSRGVKWLEPARDPHPRMFQRHQWEKRHD